MQATPAIADICLVILVLKHTSLQSTQSYNPIGAIRRPVTNSSRKPSNVWRCDIFNTLHGWLRDQRRSQESKTMPVRDDAMCCGVGCIDRFLRFRQRRHGASRQAAWPFTLDPTHHGLSRSTPRRPQALRCSWLERRADPAMAG